MAAVMEALLKIKADVTGENEIRGLTGQLQGVQRAGMAASTSLKGLAGSAMGAVGGFKTLLPLVSGAGILALAKNSIDAGNKMYDLSQKTGVSVEALSRFSKAAKVSGTDIDTVAKAAQKFSRALVEGTANEALRSIGINARDASGKLKPTSDLMLEIADRFKAMPDGAQKTALAIQLFGRSGAELIPTLNMGAKAISDYGAMTTEYAKKANDASDKTVVLQGKVNALGGKFAVVLIPFMIAATDALTSFVDAFNKIPEPLQKTVVAFGSIAIAVSLIAGPLMNLIKLLGVVAGATGLGALGATIAGWAGAVGPAVTAITAALGGLLTWVTTTLLPGLVAVFSGPVGWAALAIIAVTGLCIVFRKQLGDLMTWWFNLVGETFKNIFNGLKQYTESATQVFISIGAAFNQYVIKPIGDLWGSAMEFLPKAMQKAAQFVQGVWNGLINAIRDAFNGFINNINDRLNGAIAQVNRLIDAYNRLPTPNISRAPSVSLPRFATGGVVSGPTVAMVGEGGQREYIVPESRMAAASARYLSGARGSAVLSGGGGATQAVINVTTGPVIEQNGQRYVSVQDLEKAMRITANGVISALRTPSARTALGMI